MDLHCVSIAQNKASLPPLGEEKLAPLGDSNLCEAKFVRACELMREGIGK